jgi:hypothetical protein
VQWKGGVTRVEIGDDNTFRENVTAKVARLLSVVALRQIEAPFPETIACNYRAKKKAAQTSARLQTERNVLALRQHLRALVCEQGLAKRCGSLRAFLLAARRCSTAGFAGFRCLGRFSSGKAADRDDRENRNCEE